MARISIVRNIHINDVVLSSTILIGDIVDINLRNKALAVQREVSSYHSKEGNFDDYRIFSKPIPQPDVYEQVDFNVVNRSPYIKVGDVDVIGISTSALLQVGSNQTIRAESRTKHIRQLKGSP